ncbi:MAG: class I SAM-dependent methyltransferase, partial [Acidimicrobiales bacterium]
MAGRDRWMLDERASAGRENLDPVHVARYDHKEDADGPAEAALVRSLVSGDGPTIVDLGAGTGQFTLAAARLGGRVVAVDVSEPMLAQIAAQAGSAGLTNVECVESGFLTYEHGGGPADIVYSRYALHHLSDFWKGIALARIASMLRPGGVLRLVDIVYSVDPDDAEVVVRRWLAHSGAHRIEQAWTRAELEEHVREEQSTFSWLLEPMI